MGLGFALFCYTKVMLFLEVKQIFVEFQKHFDTEEKCREFLEQQRWGNTPACPHCGSTERMAEHGQRNVKVLTLKSIADACKMDIKEFL